MLAALTLLGHLHEEARHQRAPDVGVIILVLKRCRHEVEPVALHDPRQLLPHVVGALQAAERQEVVVAPLAGILLRLRRLEGVVDVEEGEVVAVGVGKELLHLVGALAGCGRAHEDLRDGEEGGEGEDFVGAVELRRGDEHDSECGIQWELGRQFSEGSKVSGGSQYTILRQK